MISLAAVAGLSLFSGCPRDRDADPEAASAKLVEREATTARATADYEHHRRLRIGTLRGEHLVARTQPMLIGALAEAIPLTSAARDVVLERLRTFQIRIDEAGNAIESLERIDAARWPGREADVTRAMLQLEAARDAAWQALRDGTRITSS